MGRTVRSIPDMDIIQYTRRKAHNKLWSYSARKKRKNPVKTRSIASKTLFFKQCKIIEEMNDE